METPHFAPKQADNCKYPNSHANWPPNQVRLCFVSRCWVTHRSLLLRYKRVKTNGSTQQHCALWKTWFILPFTSCLCRCRISIKEFAYFWIIGQWSLFQPQALGCFAGFPLGTSFKCLDIEASAQFGLKPAVHRGAAPSKNTPEFGLFVPGGGFPQLFKPCDLPAWLFIKRSDGEWGGRDCVKRQIVETPGHLMLCCHGNSFTSTSPTHMRLHTQSLSHRLFPLCRAEWEVPNEWFQRCFGGPQM